MAQKYVCQICGYVYDPKDGDLAKGIGPGISFKTLASDWLCPECNAPKSEFFVIEPYDPDDGFEDDTYESYVENEEF